MAHTDRQPTDEVFNDIKHAAEGVWINSNNHQDYIWDKIDQRKGIDNYADNWCGFIQQFDTNNQIMFFEALELQDSVDFLRVQRHHYGYFVPRIKK